MMIEINTKSYIELGITYPDVQFFPIIKELEIPVMVNSDCHYPDKVIDGYEEIYKKLKEAGITETVDLTEEGWVF